MNYDQYTHVNWEEGAEMIKDGGYSSTDHDYGSGWDIIDQMWDITDQMYEACKSLAAMYRPI
jgi:hypothetical protein